MIILVLLAIMLGEQGFLATVNDWWADELFSLWASDPTENFGNLFRYRIATDSNPPLYFSLLFVARQFISDNRLAILTLNVSFLLSAALSAFLASRRLSNAWVLFFFGLLALGGPGAAYLAEGRSYFLAMSIVSIAVVLTLVAIEAAELQPGWWAFAITGALASLTHVFAALLCCSLAAGLAILALQPSQRRLFAPAAVLGLSTVVAFAAWIGSWAWLGPRSFSQIGWIPFTFDSVADAARGVLAMTFGQPALALPFLGFLIVSLIFGASRQVAALLIVSTTLFVSIPILISFFVPIVLARYWLIGAPLLMGGLVFLVRKWAVIQNGRPTSKLIVVIGTGYIVLTAVTGYFTAYEFVASKPIWKGASVIGPVPEQCGSRAIRVLGFLPGFSIVTKAPRSTFVDVQTLSGNEPLQETQCPVLGWSEHYILRFGEGYINRATDADLLKLLKIPSRPDNIQIDRHESGFVVRRRG
jgi:hypothetical protein